MSKGKGRNRLPLFGLSLAPVTITGAFNIFACVGVYWKISKVVVLAPTGFPNMYLGVSGSGPYQIQITLFQGPGIVYPGTVWRVEIRQPGLSDYEADWEVPLASGPDNYYDARPTCVAPEQVRIFQT